MRWAPMRWWAWRSTRSCWRCDRGCFPAIPAADGDQDAAPDQSAHTESSDFLRIADGAAGFNARGTEQARNLLQMELHGVGAQNLGLRETDAGVAHLIHAGFEIGNVLLQIDSLGRTLKRHL